MIVTELITFVDNNPQLKEFKINIYCDINTCGWFGTEPFYLRFTQLFEATRRHYINERGKIFRITTLELIAFCQHFVNEYELIKDKLGILGILK